MYRPLPPRADAARDSVAPLEEAGRPGAMPVFGYRSEAFAEDLSIFEAPQTVPRPRGRGRRRAFAVSMAWMWRRARRRLRPPRR